MSPPVPNPEQLQSFDRAVINIQRVLDSSPRTQAPEDDLVKGMTRCITFGVYSASEHVDEQGQRTYRIRSTVGAEANQTDSVWVFDPQTKKVQQGRESMLHALQQDPAEVPLAVPLELGDFGLELSDMTELPGDSYSLFADQLPQLFAVAKANKQVGYPQSALSVAVGRLSLKRLARRKKQ